MEINCEFKNILFSEKEIYTCKISKANITEEDHVFKEFKGDHEEGKTHNDVRCVWFDNTNVNHFPQGLQKHFPVLSHLIVNAGDMNIISRHDLKGLEGLDSLWINNCQLRSLPDDLFTEMPNLREVNFGRNEIEFASSKLFEPLLGRENIAVDLRGNKSIDAWFASQRDGSLKSFGELMKLIDEKCIKPTPITVSNPVNFNSKIKELWVSGKFSDLTIIVGNKEFKVHKNILAMQSEVFANLLRHYNDTELELPGFSSRLVETLLKFIYTNEVFDEGNAMDNLKIAEQFKVADMKWIYEKIIGDQISEENVWEIFMFAHRCSSQILKKKTFRLIVKQIPDKVPEIFMEDPGSLKRLIDARDDYDNASRVYNKT